MTVVYGCCFGCHFFQKPYIKNVLRHEKSWLGCLDGRKDREPAGQPATMLSPSIKFFISNEQITRNYYL